VFVDFLVSLLLLAVYKCDHLERLKISVSFLLVGEHWL
jgi:hypothetical protein